MGSWGQIPWVLTTFAAVFVVSVCPLRGDSSDSADTSRVARCRECYRRELLKIREALDEEPTGPAVYVPRSKNVIVPYKESITLEEALAASGGFGNREPLAVEVCHSSEKDSWVRCIPLFTGNPESFVLHEGDIVLKCSDDSTRLPDRKMYDSSLKLTLDLPEVREAEVGHPRVYVSNGRDAVTVAPHKQGLRIQDIVGEIAVGLGGPGLTASIMIIRRTESTDRFIQLHLTTSAWWGEFPLEAGDLVYMLCERR